MRLLPGAVLVLAFAMPFCVSAQPTPQPAPKQVAGQFVVDARITLDSEVLGTPALSVNPGANFSVRLGKEGERLVSLSGMVAPINERAAALDYTIELELPGKLGTDIRRMSQTVRMTLGESLEVGSLKDAEGRTLRLVFKVSAAR